MNDTHDELTDRLSDYIDDELSPADRARVDEHLAGCAGCRAVLEDLRTVIGVANRLPGRLPDRELWPGVATRIERRPPRRFSFTAPQLIAAGIALMLMSGALVYMARSSGDARTDIAAGTPVANPAVIP